MSDRKLREDTKEDKYGRNFERASPSDVEFKLSVPDGLIPEGMVGHWFSDAEAGRIPQKVREWWVPVTNERGEHITATSGGGKMHLMMIEKELNEKDHLLREKRYRATVDGVVNSPDLGQGVESYRPSGEGKIKISKDRDAFA